MKIEHIYFDTCTNKQPKGRSVRVLLEEIVLEFKEGERTFVVHDRYYTYMTLTELLKQSRANVQAA